MGQTNSSTYFPGSVGFQPRAIPNNCPWCSASGLECDGACLKNLPGFAYNNPYCPNYRSHQRRHSEQQQRHSRPEGVVKRSSSPGFRRSQSRSVSTSSAISVAHSAGSYSRHGTPFPSGSAADSALIAPRPVVVPVEEQALCFFLANWVLLPRQGRTGGYMEYIIPLYSSCRPNSHLYYALSAVSLASFGNRPSCRRNGSKSVSARASLVYAKALERTNRALMDPLLAKEDETLAAVLMLGFFETLTTYKCQTAWGSHNEGAIALVRLRGADNIKTRAGRLLFAAVRTQTLIKCLTQSKLYHRSVNWTEPQTFRDVGASGMTELNMKLIELRSDCNRIMTAEGRRNDPANAEKVLNLLARAQAAKQAFLIWASTQTDMWSFGPTAVIETLPPGINLLESEFFPGRIDVYHELWIASVWNMARTTGLMFSSVTVRCAAWLNPQVDFRTLPEYIEASRFDRKIVVDMIASVPFLLGWHKRQSRKDFLVPPEELQSQIGYTLSGYACGDDSPGTKPEHGKALGGYFSMWPMFVAGCSDFSTEAESRWIHGRLRFIADHMGIHQAKYFACAKVRLPSMTVLRDRAELASASSTPPGGAGPSATNPNAQNPNNNNTNQGHTSPNPQNINPPQEEHNLESEFIKVRYVPGRPDSQRRISLGVGDPAGNITTSTSACSTAGASPEMLYKREIGGMGVVA